MKVVILAGGRAERMGGASSAPKPLIKIAGKPIVAHIINHFQKQGLSEFVLAVGHRGDEIRAYFDNRDSGHIDIFNTGENAGNAGRLLPLRNLLSAAPFVLAWCDGLLDLDIARLMEFHQQGSYLISMVVAHPTLAYGLLDIAGDAVTNMREKPLLEDLWVNAGVYIVSPQVIDRIESAAASWESDILPKLIESGQVGAFRHEGFWRTVDTPKDAATLNDLFSARRVPDIFQTLESPP